MKNKALVAIYSNSVKKPPKKEVSEAEFREKLKNIDEWRKQRLAELCIKNSR
jgi:hypothetical protein